MPTVSKMEWQIIFGLKIYINSAISRFKFQKDVSLLKLFRKGVPCTFENYRKVLSEALYHIRFPAMDIHDFANGPAKTGILTCQVTLQNL